MYETVWPPPISINYHLCFHGENPNIIGSFSEFGRIAYVTKSEKIRGKMKDNIFKVIMVGYT